MSHSDTSALPTATGGTPSEGLVLVQIVDSNGNPDVVWHSVSPGEVEGDSSPDPIPADPSSGNKGKLVTLQAGKPLVGR